MDWAAHVSYLSYSVGAIIAGICAVWIARFGDPERSDRWSAVVALALTANWCVAAASFDPDHSILLLTEVAANVAWLATLLRHFANDGRDESVRMVRPVALALGFVEALQLALILLAYNAGWPNGTTATVFETSAMFRMLVATGSLVMVHNLYVGASPRSRQILRWNAAAMAGFWAFTLNFYNVAWLSGSYPAELVATRGLAVAMVAIPFAIGFNQKAAGLTFSPSRTVTFRFLSLMVIGTYLAAMLLFASWLSLFEENAGRLTQVGLLVGAAALALIWLPSDKLRGWAKVTAIKHLFKYRYDYRNEWIRFTHTMGRSTNGDSPLQERAVKALAEITESPSGALLLSDEDGTLQPGGHWRWPDLRIPGNAISPELAQIFEKTGLILDLDESRAGVEHQGELDHLPQWFLEDDRVWAVVPLLHFERLIGLIVLSRPLIDRKLDWEDFDLLGVVGQQLASYLSEQAGQEALSEATRFDEFNRRMAFVMHDIKNLSSQMSLLLRNAEKHAEKPEFRKDMLITLRNSADKLNTMLARLGRYGTAGQEQGRDFDITSHMGALIDRYSALHTITLLRSEPLQVSGNPEGFEQAAAHILQNAIEASDPESAVMLEIFSDGLSGIVQIVDSGKGMSPSFIRSGLFTPFVSSKDGGFGIGAYEARELIRSMGGRLDVESREGLGTRFTISLPLASAHALLGAKAITRKEAA
ncbi:XrtA/PEP-CTERM system histidine kinase PrsK [Qipengyuania sp. 483]|nr:PEP-CTERM system histidine kinase PrsK [Erythrobacter sp.]